MLRWKLNKTSNENKKNKQNRENKSIQFYPSAWYTYFDIYVCRYKKAPFEQCPPFKQLRECESMMTVTHIPSNLLFRLWYFSSLYAIMTDSHEITRRPSVQKIKKNVACIDKKVHIEERMKI